MTREVAAAMRRALIAIAGILTMIAAATAEDATPGAGRYQITPSEEGFTRLDTKTGSISHCDKSDGVWRCTPLAGADDAVQSRLDEVAGAVTDLAAAVDSLTEQVGALTGRLDALTTRVEAGGRLSLEEEAQRREEALSFAEQVMQRFFDMVRDIKHAEQGDRI